MLRSSVLVAIACVFLTIASVAVATPPVLTVCPIATAPRIDGTAGQQEWRGASVTNILHRLGSEELLPGAPEISIAYDDQALYIAAIFPLSPGAKPKASAQARDGATWDDDAIEVFIDPTSDHKGEYQFILNAAGTHTDLRSEDLGWSRDWQGAASVHPGCWQAELAIPWTVMDPAGLGARTEIGLNLAWDRKTPAPLNGTWAPMLAGSFHHPEAFGRLQLRRQGPAVSCRLAEEASVLGFRLDCPVAGAAAPEALLKVTKGTSTLAERSVAVAEPTKLTVPTPRKQGRPEGGEYRCELRVNARGEAAPLLLQSGVIVVRPPLVVELRQFALAGRVTADVDATALVLEKDPARVVEAWIVAPEGKGAERQRCEKLTAGKTSFDFDTSTLAAGKHTVVVEARNGAGQCLVAEECTFTKPPAPAWLGSKAGISQQVLAPWTPLQVEHSGSGITVKPWGRAYRFVSLPFPEQIQTRDASVLAGPMKLRLIADGKPVLLRGQLKPSTSRGDQVVLRGEAAGRLISCTSTVTIDFDGNAKVDLRLRGERNVTIDSLTLEMPVKAANARYLYHFPGSWGASRNARAMPSEGFTSAFVPYVWVGDEDRGLALYTESDENWFPAASKNAVEVLPRDETVLVRFNIIQGKVALDAAQARKGLAYTFGLQATPVKQPDRDVWDYRICHCGNYGLEKQTSRGSSSVVYPGGRNINPAAGTLELWARVRFDPQAPVVDQASRGSLNRDLISITGGQDTLGLYWNIDDRGMRAYLRHGQAYPFAKGAQCDWREGEWHHIALSWGEEVRVYVDGKLMLRAPWKGSVGSAAADAALTLGGPQAGFDIDELEISGVQREPDLSGAFQADGDTLLLDHLEKMLDQGWQSVTVPERGEGGVVSGSARLAEGKFGKALAMSSQAIPTLQYLKSLGVRTIVFHEHWTEYENYPETLGHQDQLKSLVKACHEQGIQLLLYFGYLMANTCPEWEPYHSEVLALPRQGEYSRKPDQKDYTVCYQSAWQDFIADGIARLMDKYDIDGVYLDGTEYPQHCNNRAHGCGYVRPDGTVAQTYSIFGAREMVRRIYTIVKSRKPEGQVNIHNSTCMTTPSLGWGTSSWDGEQFGSIARGVDVNALLPLDAFRCEFMGRQWGVPAEFLCYNRPYTAHEAFSFTLLHDVLVRGSGPALEEESALWKAMDAFGRREASFLPYWSNGDVARVTPDRCYVSIYSRPGTGALCVVSNLSANAADVTVSLDLARLKLPPDVSAWDAFSHRTVALSKGAFTVPLRSFDYAVVRLGQAPR